MKRSNKSKTDPLIQLDSLKIKSILSCRVSVFQNLHSFDVTEFIFLAYFYKRILSNLCWMKFFPSLYYINAALPYLFLICRTLSWSMYSIILRIFHQVCEKIFDWTLIPNKELFTSATKEIIIPYFYLCNVKF